MKSKTNFYTDLSTTLRLPVYRTPIETVKLTLKTFFKSFWFLTKVIFPFYLPAQIIDHFLLPSHKEVTSAVSLFDLIFDALIMPAVIYGITHYYKKGSFPTVLESYNFGFKKWGLIWARGFKAGFFMLCGLVMLIVPGLFAFVAYQFVPYSICFESNKQKNSLKRSRELTLGNRKFIVLCVLIIFLIQFVPNLFIQLPASLLPDSLIKTCLMTFSDLLSNIVYETYVIVNLLIFLKLAKDKKKKPKENWLLRWAP